MGATLGSIVSLVGAAAALPQPLTLLTDRDLDLSGLSPARWRLGAGSAASWVGYGWMENQPTVWLSAGFGLLCAVVVCTILRARHTTEVDPVRPCSALTPRRGAATSARLRRARCSPPPEFGSKMIWCVQIRLPDTTGVPAGTRPEGGFWDMRAPAARPPW